MQYLTEKATDTNHDCALQGCADWSYGEHGPMFAAGPNDLQNWARHVLARKLTDLGADADTAYDLAAQITGRQ